MNAAFERAVKIVGGPARMLEELLKRRPTSKIKAGHLYHWRNKMPVLPSDYCPDVEAITAAAGQPVRCEELNPTVDWAVVRNGSADVVVGAESHQHGGAGHA